MDVFHWVDTSSVDLIGSSIKKKKICVKFSTSMYHVTAFFNLHHTVINLVNALVAHLSVQASLLPLVCFDCFLILF